jgi:hypothetical protein
MEMEGKKSKEKSEKNKSKIRHSQHRACNSTSPSDRAARRRLGGAALIAA